MKRIFYNTNGEVVAVNYPHQRYLGGTFVDDKTKPIYKEVDDLSKPIYSDPLPGMNKVKRIIGYEKKQEIDGYEKKELTLDDCKIPDDLKDYSYITTSEDAPEHEYTNQMIIVDGAITVDTDKTKTIMPPKFIKAKEIAYQKALIDSELTKETPDAVELLRAQRKIEKVVTMTDTETYEMAIENLSRAETAKPEVEAMLREKVGK